jgi:hypothetical protein
MLTADDTEIVSQTIVKYLGESNGKKKLLRDGVKFRGCPSEVRPES